MRNRFLLAAFLGLLVFPACAAPILPLPPPAVGLVEAPDADGFATVRGEARSGVFVSCLNENRDEGVIVRAEPDGTFVIRIAADSGDLLTVWQWEAGNPGGQQTRVTVPDP